MDRHQDCDAKRFRTLRLLVGVACRRLTAEQVLELADMLHRAVRRRLAAECSQMRRAA